MAIKTLQCVDRTHTFGLRLVFLLRSPDTDSSPWVGLCAAFPVIVRKLTLYLLYFFTPTWNWVVLYPLPFLLFFHPSVYSFLLRTFHPVFPGLFHGVLYHTLYFGLDDSWDKEISNNFRETGCSQLGGTPWNAVCSDSATWFLQTIPPRSPVPTSVLPQCAGHVDSFLHHERAQAPTCWNSLPFSVLKVRKTGPNAFPQCLPLRFVYSENLNVVHVLALQADREHL